MGLIGIARELPDSPKGSIQTGDNSKATFTREFLVEFDSHFNGAIDAITAPGIPTKGQYYSFGDEYHLLARVVDKSADRLGPNSKCWRVTVKYETREAEEDQFENPLLEPPEISLTFENSREAVYFELSGDAPIDGIKNSAGELFNPPPEKDVARPVLTIKRNEEISSPIVGLSVSYVNSINSGAFWGAGQGQAKITGIEVNRQFKDIADTGLKFPYLEVTYRIAFKFDTWHLVLLDYGSYYIEDGYRREFKTEEGHPHLDLLDCGGKPGGPCFLPPFQIYPYQDFGALSLPQSFED